MPRAESSVERGIAIEILPPSVADGIAAGEVIDRPAAVVKELVENAIDAGATRVAVRAAGAGQRLIEVVDDGWGMTAEDLPLAFKRHATSKLRSLDQLRRIETLGFRGEALASIAAVAQVEAVSRRRERGEGYRVQIEGGELRTSGAAGSPAGTRITVRDLFYRTPARLKFLKQAATENAVISRLVGEFALAHPAVAFSLEIDGRRALESGGSGELRDAFASIYGPETASAMLSVEEASVSGLISPPAIQRRTKDQVVILVNRRRVHHRNLAFAVEQAYRGLRDPDRFPLAVLELRIDPEEVDVNVHPTKREVRFRNEGAIFAQLERACYHALRQSPVYQLQATSEGPRLELRESAVISSSIGFGIEPTPIAPSLPDQRMPPLTYVGQLLQSYLVAESPGAAVLVDQHAAHERVIFDRLSQRLEERRPDSQLLLIPHLVDLRPEQLAALERHASYIRELGFEAEPFGTQTLRLLSVPSDLPEARANRVLELLLDDLAHERSADRRLHETGALIACHSAVRFGDSMSREAASQLLSSLAKTREPISCPHGRPTTLILPEAHLRRLFKRP